MYTAIMRIPKLTLVLTLVVSSLYLLLFQHAFLLISSPSSLQASSSQSLKARIPLRKFIRKPSPLRISNISSTATTINIPNVLVIVVSINRDYTSSIAARSVRAYVRRHGYRLYVQKQWRGLPPPSKDKRLARTQKLIACSEFASGEKYVLVIDSDVVISPWTPPIDTSVGEYLGPNIGIVDQDQPSTEIADKIFKLRLKEPFPKAQIYYSIFGDNFPDPHHGILNSGVLLLQPKQGHCYMLKNLYNSKRVRRYLSTYHDHYDQPILGSMLLRTGNYKRLHHAWNRGWAMYHHAHRVGGKRYTLEEVFRKSYFMHLYWDKDDKYTLDALMKRKNITFDPEPYAIDLYL